MAYIDEKTEIQNIISALVKTSRGLPGFSKDEQKWVLHQEGYLIDMDHRDIVYLVAHHLRDYGVYMGALECPEERVLEEKALLNRGLMSKLQSRRGLTLIKADYVTTARLLANPVVCGIGFDIMAAGPATSKWTMDGCAVSGSVARAAVHMLLADSLRAEIYGDVVEVFPYMPARRDVDEVLAALKSVILDEARRDNAEE